MATSFSNTLIFKKTLPFTNHKSLPISIPTFHPVIHNQPVKLRLTATRAVSGAHHESVSSVLQNEMEKDGEKKLSERWREIMGEDEWAGLIDPMDPLLRNELIRYGEMAQACYDAFDFDPYSKYCGSCKFKRRDFFDGLGLVGAGYNVTRYLYATSNINLPMLFRNSRWPKVWSKNANWIGFIGVSNDEMTKKLGRRDVCVVWRGTVTRYEWAADLTDFLRSSSSDKIPSPDREIRVESGFLDLYTDKDEKCKYCESAARQQVLDEVQRLVNHVYPDEELSITFTGHSLGGALALLSAYDILETGYNVRSDTSAVSVCAFTFAAPRVGNERFKKRTELLGLKVLRVVNIHDLVPRAPGLFVNEDSHPTVRKYAEQLRLPWQYSHVGVKLALDHKNSPFLKPNGDMVCAHNMEAYLHLLDGYHGTGERFMLANGRDYALVNKSCDFVKDEYEIPPNWRQDYNKGMVRNKEGRWMQQDRDIFDEHPVDMNQRLKQIRI